MDVTIGHKQVVFHIIRCSFIAVKIILPTPTIGGTLSPTNKKQKFTKNSSVKTNRGTEIAHM